MNVPIISVTGTKGKTTTVALIADILQKLGHGTLKVDTTGHFLNGERRSSLEDAKNIWGLVPTVAPGKYLFEFLLNPSLKENAVAVLETALGSSALPGIGYRNHLVGVFLNVFEDHIGSSERLRSQHDIADAKQFIFERLDPRGQATAVFNADDELVVQKLDVIENKDKVRLLPIGLSFKSFDIDAHLAAGGKAITRKGDEIIVLSKNEEIILADLTQIPWTFGGRFEPSVWNLLAAIGAIYGYYQEKLPEGFRKAVEATRLDPYGGRLTVLKSSDGVTIVADYAHERVSLQKVAELAKTQVSSGGRVIGVVRLAYDRTDELLRETGHVIGKSYDEVIVYDKIDGHWRQPLDNTYSKFKQVTGRTSEIVYSAVQEVNPHSVRIIREDEAILHAAKVAKPGDVVVVIVNDDIARSIGFIRESFKAEFL